MSGQPGKTFDVNAIRVPSGDQSGPPAPVGTSVTRRASPPSAGMIQIWLEPSRSETKASDRPSGDQRGE